MKSLLVNKHSGVNCQRSLEIGTLLSLCGTGVLAAAWEGVPLLSSAASRGDVRAGSGISVF